MSKRLVLILLFVAMACGCFGCATDTGVGFHVGSRESKFIERGPGPVPAGFPGDLDRPMTVGVASVQF